MVCITRPEVGPDTIGAQLYQLTKVSELRTRSPGVKSTLSEPAEFPMCRTRIQAIKALVVYTLNSASLKTIEASH